MSIPRFRERVRKLLLVKFWSLSSLILILRVHHTDNVVSDVRGERQITKKAKWEKQSSGMFWLHLASMISYIPRWELFSGPQI